MECVMQVEGLRERKRRAARETIAATARRLFAERGFDAVTVSQVAAAADVSEKTVFNYFPTKEDLAFAGREEGVARLVNDITERPPGTSVLDVFRALTATVLDDFLTPGESLLTIAKIMRNSPALQQRLTVGWDSGAADITTAVAETSGAADGDLVPAIVARSLWFTHRSIFLLALQGLLAEEDREQLIVRLRAAADMAYDQFADGLQDYGTGT
jgi:AcrR family transcriptional regulator